MRIAILTQYYPPEMGAPQARLSGLANRLVERGHQVTVLTAMPNYPAGRIQSGYSGLWKKEEMAGARILRTAIYPTKRLGVRRLASYFSFVASAALLGSVQLPAVDVLFTESPPLFLGMAGYWLSRVKRARWIFNVSDLWPESAVRLGAVQAGASLRMAYALEAFCYRKSWLVSGQSREILANIADRFPGVNTFHLSNGVNPEQFSPRFRTREAREQLGPGDFIALYAGLHGIAQGLDQVLDSAARLQDVPGLRIVFLGDGPEKARLMSAARERNLTNVRFLDAAAKEKLPALVASADAVLAPLKSYLPGAVPSKIYEGMAAGLPVVLAGAGEAADIITRSAAGIVVQPGDSEALASSLRRLADSPALCRALGDGGLHAARTEFNRRLILDRFIDYLEEHLPIPDSMAADAASHRPARWKERIS